MDIDQIMHTNNNNFKSWIDIEIDTSFNTISNCISEQDSYKNSPVYSEEPIHSVIIKLEELVRYKYRLAEIYYLLSKCYVLINDKKKREHYLRESIALDNNRIEPLLDMISILELDNPYYEKKLNNGELLALKKLVEPILIDQINIGSNQIENKVTLARIFINYKDDVAKKLILELMLEHQNLNGFYMYSRFWPQDDFFIYPYFEHLKTLFPKEPNLYAFISSCFHRLGDFKNEYYYLLVAESLEKSDPNIYSDRIRFEHEMINFNTGPRSKLRELDIELAQTKFKELDLNSCIPDNLAGTWKNDEYFFTIDKNRRVYLEFYNGQKAYGYCSKVVNNKGTFKVTPNYDYYSSYNFEILIVKQNYLEFLDLDKNMVDSYIRVE